MTTTSGQEGLDLLARLQEIDPRLPVIVMTAWGNIDLAVESIKRGARDFIQKPWENERLISLVRVHAELHQALKRARQLELENRLLRAEGMPDFVAGAPSMQPVLELISQVGPSDANVLITGEHGTGKEIVSKLLHSASPRSRMALVTVNAEGLPEGTFESEIFGHVKGAFTDARSDRIGRFELANGGTLFLDEIANVPLRQQAKLLRVLETGELERVGSSQTRRVDVRVLSATNADLSEEAKTGNFREDLLFRINTVEIHIPALRERREDIPLLAMHFLNRNRSRYRKQITSFSTASMQQMMQYPWPGNVRELEHTVERAVLLARGEETHRQPRHRLGAVLPRQTLRNMRYRRGRGFPSSARFSAAAMATYRKPPKLLDSAGPRSTVVSKSMAYERHVRKRSPSALRRAHGCPLSASLCRRSYLRRNTSLAAACYRRARPAAPVLPFHLSPSDRGFAHRRTTCVRCGRPGHHHQRRLVIA